MSAYVGDFKTHISQQIVNIDKGDHFGYMLFYISNDDMIIPTHF